MRVELAWNDFYMFVSHFICFSIITALPEIFRMKLKAHFQVWDSFWQLKAL